ncbi:MAG: cation diffusion facilitator family transporter [Alphaproteobacteria bacterium]|nr:cation diffusion facilitator family transporter [Alphaproteobacteria bacterium]
MTCTHDEPKNNDGQRLIAALAVISVFMVVEVIGGLIASSLALLADAVHMMTDALALGLAASAQWFANRPADEKRHFGYQRGQVLAAFVNGVLLMAMLVWIVYEAVQRFMTPTDVAWRPMLIVAILGLFANAVAFAILHRSGQHNINIRGALLHVVSDLFGSVAAVVAAIVIALTAATWVDPLLSLLVAGLIARSAGKLLAETGHILLEGAPTDIDVSRLSERISELSDGIEDVHGVHIWQMKPGDTRIILHARIKEGASSQRILEKVKRELAGAYGIVDSTVQIEVGECCEVSESVRKRAATEGARAHALHCSHEGEGHGRRATNASVA